MTPQDSVRIAFMLHQPHLASAAASIKVVWLNAGSHLLLILQMVYNAVLDAHTSVIAAMKPGVSWPVSSYAHIDPMSAMQLSVRAGRLCNLGTILWRSHQEILDALVVIGPGSTSLYHSCQ